MRVSRSSMSVKAVLLDYVCDGLLTYRLVNKLVCAADESSLVFEALFRVGRAANEVGLGVAIRNQVLVEESYPAHQFRAIHTRHAEVSEDKFEQPFILLTFSFDQPDSLF